MSRWLRSAPRPAWGVAAQHLAWGSGAGAQAASHAEGTRAALAELAGATQVDAIASTDLALHWVQKPPAATRSLAELQLVAAARCVHLHGGSPGDWWIAADWTTRRPFVCAALPRAVVAPLQQACAARGVQLRWHTGWSVLAGARSSGMPGEGWSALRTPRRTHLWHCTGGRVDALHAFAVTPEADEAEVAAAVRTRMLVESSAASLPPGTVHWTERRGTDSEALCALSLAPLLAEQRP